MVNLCKSYHSFLKRKEIMSYAGVDEPSGHYVK